MCEFTALLRLVLVLAFTLFFLFTLFHGKTRFLLQMGVQVLRRYILDPCWRELCELYEVLLCTIGVSLL